MYYNYFTQVRSMDVKYEKCKSEEDTSPSSDTSIDLEEDRLLPHGAVLTSPAQKARQRWRAVVPHVCYFVFWLLVFLVTARYAGKKYYIPDLVYSPAKESISYVIMQPEPDWKLAEDPYVGAPTPEKDKNWLELIHYTPIAIHEDEFVRFNKEGVKLEDGSGYLSALTVYHELHCLRKLHRNMYPEHYAPNQTHERWLKIRDHAQHCLKILLDGVLCHSDITIRTMQWEENDVYPAVSENPRQCRDFWKIDEWAKSRSVTPWAPGMLMHPKLGAPFETTPEPDVILAADV